MSHTVARGKPTASQLYLDTVLDEILREQGIEPTISNRDQVTLTQCIFHCLKRNPGRVFMTNGATSEDLTSAQILDYAVSLARTLTAQGAKGKSAICCTRNHERAIGIYFGAMFSGVLTFMMDPYGTEFEFSHFVKLVEPSYIFYDEVYHGMMTKVLKTENVSPILMKANIPECFEKFVQGHTESWDNYQVESAYMDDEVLLLPTSGTTGLPKAAVMTQRGLLTHLPSPWSYHTRFPTPTDKAMVLTTMQWMTFTLTVTSCAVYDVPILISPITNTAESVTIMLEKFRPTWTFMAPSFAASLLNHIRPDQWASLEQLILVGSPVAADLLAALKEKFPKSGQIRDGYGTTEAQGFICVPDPEANGCCGWVLNCMLYKIVDENGQELGLNNAGELYLKGINMIQRYYKNKQAWIDSCTPDGWFRTGDEFYVDQSERLTFRVRKKFSFKFMGRQVAPEEVENVICSVPGVHESVVCLTDKGPTAAVVLQPNAVVTRDQIHQAVDSRLSDHKRLHGGIVFVPSLPHTNTGKLQRRDCSKLIDELIKSGQS